MRIRALTVADWPAFRALRLEALRAHPEAFATTAADWDAAARERTEAALRDSEGASDNVVLGAFAPALVGMVGFRREARATVAHKGSLWGLYVEPAVRRGGIGAGLIGRALEHACGVSGLAYVRAVVTAETPAARLFLATGFAPYGREAAALRTADGAFDQTYFRIEL